ncbi:unnamed protein product, partial [Gulo gulo]
RIHIKQAAYENHFKLEKLPVCTAVRCEGRAEKEGAQPVVAVEVGHPVLELVGVEVRFHNSWGHGADSGPQRSSSPHAAPAQPSARLPPTTGTCLQPV